VTLNYLLETVNICVLKSGSESSCLDNQGLGYIFLQYEGVIFQALNSLFKVLYLFFKLFF
jgi:hypothetical protein